MKSPLRDVTVACLAAGLFASAHAQAQGAPPALPPPAPPPSTPSQPVPPVVYTQPAPVATPAPAAAPVPYQETVPERKSHERTAFNTVFVELLGNGGLYSLNYDRIVADYLSIRAGLSYISVGAAAGSASASATLMTFPVMANFLVGSPSHKLELGAGPLFAYVSASTGTGGPGGTFSGSGFGVAGTAVIGYRYVPYDGGFHFKVGFTPLIGVGGFLPWGGISFGYTF